jgi:predicted glycosyltransferase
MTPRFAFYTNELTGSLGHLRRTLAIAERLAHFDRRATSMIFTGSAIEPFFALPPRTDTVKLPARRRLVNGDHRSARLELGLDELQTLRTDIALAATTAFSPDVVLVDQVPLGLGDELEPVLETMKDRGVRLVLGLRDIEDSPARVARKWGPGMREVIEHYYDAVMIYGPVSCPNALRCMGWEDITVPAVYTGYVSPILPKTGPLDLAPGYLLATAGGGDDGFPVLEAVVRAIRLQPIDRHTVLVTGPLMPEQHIEALRELAEGADITIFESRTDMHELIVGARAVVCMAGYNTVSEVMQARKPALLVPRVRPTEEQLVRAHEVSRRGLQDMLHPDELSPRTMRDALDRLLARTPMTHSSGPGSFGGTELAVGVLHGLVGEAPHTTSIALAEGAA